MDENSFVVGYKSVPSFVASTGGYTLQGDYNANITCTVGEPEISYNSLTGVLTVTNIKAEVLGRVHYSTKVGYVNSNEERKE